MKDFARNGRGRGLPLWALVVCLACVLAGVAPQASAQDVEELLTQVGQEYAVAYSSPFLYSFGPNANSNMYSTAHIPWSRIVFGIGVKAMTTQLNESDQNFSKVIENVDLGVYDPALAGQFGDVLMSGPTIFGNTSTNGRVQGFFNGVEVFNAETIPGLVDSRYSPLVAPEAYIGGVMGLKATLRYFPEIDTGDYGKTKYWGFGLQWNANGVLKNLPIDVMAGFFSQELDVGSIYESSATSYFVAASKSFTLMTLYGGFATEDSHMDVNYEFIHPSDPNLNSEVSFTIDGLQDSRFTVGATLDFLAKINVEAAFGNKLTTYSAGLMFGL